MPPVVSFSNQSVFRYPNYARSIHFVVQIARGYPFSRGQQALRLLWFFFVHSHSPLQSSLFNPLQGPFGFRLLDRALRLLAPQAFFWSSVAYSLITQETAFFSVLGSLLYTALSNVNWFGILATYMQMKISPRGVSHARSTRPMRCKKEAPGRWGVHDGHVIDLEKGHAFRIVFGICDDDGRLSIAFLVKGILSLR